MSGISNVPKVAFHNTGSNNHQTMITARGPRTRRMMIRHTPRVYRAPPGGLSSLEDERADRRHAALRRWDPPPRLTSGGGCRTGSSRRRFAAADEKRSSAVAWTARRGRGSPAPRTEEKAMDAIDGNGEAALFGNHFVTQEVPTRRFPDSGMPATDAMRLVSLDLALEGDPI